MADTSASPRAETVGASGGVVSEKLHEGTQQFIDRGIELAGLSCRDIDTPDGYTLFLDRFKFWESSADGIADETKKGKAVSGMVQIKQKTTHQALPLSKWKPTVLAVLNILGAPLDATESIRREARIPKSKVAEAMDLCDAPTEEVLQRSNSSAAPEPDMNGKDSGSVVERLIHATKDLLQVTTTLHGGVKQHYDRREGILALVSQIPDTPFREGLEKLLDYQKSRFRGNSNGSWKPFFVSLLRRLGVPEADLETLRTEISRIAPEKYWETEEDLKKLGLNPEVLRLPGAAPADAGSADTRTPADVAKASERVAANASSKYREPVVAASETASADNAEAPFLESAAVGVRGLAQHEAPDPVGSPGSELVGGMSFASLPTRPMWKRPHLNKAAHAYKFNFATRDGSRKHCNIAIRQCDNNISRAERICVALYMKALETDGDADVVLALKDELMSSAGAELELLLVKQECGYDAVKKKEAKGETEGPPQKRPKREESQGAKQPAPELQDAPPGHEAHTKIRCLSNKCWGFFYGSDRLQVTKYRCGGSEKECARIARLCYVKFAEGWTKEQVLGFRQEQYERFDTPAPNAASAAAAEVAASAATMGAESKGKSGKKRKGKDTLDFTKQEAAEVKRLRASGREIELVRMHGREVEKKNSSVNGLYVQRPDGFGGVRAYEKVGKGPPRFLLYSAKRGRWFISDSMNDSQKGFAYLEATDGGASGPVDGGARSGRWQVFDGKEHGYKEDPAVQCTSVLSSEMTGDVKQEVKEELEAKVKMEPGEAQGEASAQEQAVAASQTDSSSSDDSDSDEDSDSSSATGEEEDGEQGRSPEQPLPQFVAVERLAPPQLLPQFVEVKQPVPPQPILHTARGMVCAKMLCRTLLRCSCHFAYMHQCPERLKGTSMMQ